MVLQTKDVIAIPVSDEDTAKIHSAMVTVFRCAMNFLQEVYGARLSEDDPRAAFSLMVTALMLQADAVNRMVDLILEPGATPMVKVGREVREEVRRRVREVFRETLDA